MIPELGFVFGVLAAVFMLAQLYKCLFYRRKEVLQLESRLVSQFMREIEDC